MRQRPGSTPERRLPCSSTSGRWTLTCPPPPWRTCTLLWISSSNNLRHVCSRSKVSSGATGAGPQRTIGGAGCRIRGAINVVNYAPSGLWPVRVQESENVLLEASEVIGEVQRYGEALYPKRPLNLPAFERLVRARIPRGVPEEWRSVQDYTMHDLKDAVKQAVADDKAPGSNRVMAALIAELPEPVQGFLVQAYRAILRGAKGPESWHKAIIWLMPKGTATVNLDA